MIPKEKWLKNVNAVATSRGWVHPKTGELLKSAKLTIEEKDNDVNDTTLEDVKQDESDVIDSSVVNTEETSDTKPDNSVENSEVVKKPRSKKV